MITNEYDVLKAIDVLAEQAGISGLDLPSHFDERLTKAWESGIDKAPAKWDLVCRVIDLHCRNRKHSTLKYDALLRAVLAFTCQYAQMVVRKVVETSQARQCITLTTRSTVLDKTATFYMCFSGDVDRVRQRLKINPELDLSLQYVTRYKKQHCVSPAFSELRVRRCTWLDLYDEQYPIPVQVAVLRTTSGLAFRIRITPPLGIPSKQLSTLRF